MDDKSCVEFLQWALPRLGMRWPGFRKVRRQACRRITGRIAELGLPGYGAYRAWLAQNEAEWGILARLCRITISRFFRDGRVWDRLGREVLPELTRSVQSRGGEELRCWTAGCGSGEEPYSVVLTWHFMVAQRARGLGLSVIATDIDDFMISRGRHARYPDSSLHEVPPILREEAFVIENAAQSGELNVLRQEHRDAVSWIHQDIRTEAPDGLFDVILCRNLVFTYFDAAVQQSVLVRLQEKLHHGGALVIGKHEALPSGHRLAPWFPGEGIYRVSAE